MLSHRSAKPRRRVNLPVSKANGGTLPGVDIDDNSALLERMEQAVPVDKLS